MAEFTSANVGRYMALTMDKEVLTSAVISAALPDGRLRASGTSLGPEEAHLVVLKVKYGPLLATYDIVSARTVAP